MPKIPDAIAPLHGQNALGEASHAPLAAHGLRRMIDASLVRNNVVALFLPA
jgi:hypothetical protein